MASVDARAAAHTQPAPRPGSETTRQKAKLASTQERLGRYALFRILLSTAKGFTKDQVTASAAAMTQYGIFSLFSLLLRFMSLAGLALQSNEAAREQIMKWSWGCCPKAKSA